MLTICRKHFQRDWNPWKAFVFSSHPVGIIFNFLSNCIKIRKHLWYSRIILGMLKGCIWFFNACMLKLQDQWAPSDNSFSTRKKIPMKENWFNGEHTYVYQLRYSFQGVKESSICFVIDRAVLKYCHIDWEILKYFPINVTKMLAYIMYIITCMAFFASYFSFWMDRQWQYILFVLKLIWNEIHLKAR